MANPFAQVSQSDVTAVATVMALVSSVACAELDHLSLPCIRFPSPAPYASEELIAAVADSRMGVVLS